MILRRSCCTILKVASQRYSRIFNILVNYSTYIVDNYTLHKEVFFNLCCLQTLVYYTLFVTFFFVRRICDIRSHTISKDLWFMYLMMLIRITWLRIRLYSYHEAFSSTSSFSVFFEYLLFSYFAFSNFRFLCTKRAILLKYLKI